MAKKACVFCGREPEGLLSFCSVACGGIAQPACDACREKLKDVSDRKRCALALASGRTQEPRRLKELLSTGMPRRTRCVPACPACGAAGA